MPTIPGRDERSHWRVLDDYAVGISGSGASCIMCAKEERQSRA